MRRKATPAAPRKTPIASKSAARRKPPDPLDDFLLAAARSLDLKIDPAWLPMVRANLQVTLAQAALVGEFALPDDAEPAPVFRA
jgi:hypothetical protein